MTRQDSDCDYKMMMRALEISLQGRVTAPPNPWVGCVIVKDNHIVGEGYSSPAGQAHAEVNALQKAQEKANGATAYVTLEPCSHYGRTPPCMQALIKANIARVVVGLLDPDPRVSGKGIQGLQAAGIEVIQGVAEKEIRAVLLPYLFQRITGHPYCIAKAAVSIDGRIAAKDGSSFWISGEEALNDVQQTRAESQAILIGAGTARMDKPKLTVRHSKVIPSIAPLRVVLDARGQVLPPGPLFETTQTPTLIITTKHCPEKICCQWQDHGVEVAIASPAEDGKGISLKEVWDLLGKKGILQVLVEGGGNLLGSLLTSKMIQRLHLYVGPRILGTGGIPLFNISSINNIAEAPYLHLLESKTLGNTVRIDYGVEDAHLF